MEDIVKIEGEESNENVEVVDPPITRKTTRKKKA